MRKLQTVPLGTIVEGIRSGVSPVCEERLPHDGEFGVLTLAAITGGMYDSSKAKALAAEAVQDSWPRVQAGRILITRASGSKDLVGACVLPSFNDEQRIIPDTAWQLELREDAQVPTRWILEFLRSPQGRRAIEQIARGSSGIWKITKGSFDRVKLPVGPRHRMDQASAISTQYERVGRTIESVIAAKRERKRGLMQELLTGQRRFSGFASSGKWSPFPLGMLVRPVSRPVVWDDDATYRLVSIRRRNGGLFLREEKQGAEIKTKQLFTLRAGDFVLSRMQVVHGALAVVPPEFDGCHVSGMYMVLRPAEPERLSMSFLHYLSHLPLMYRNVLLSCHGVHIEKMTFDPTRFLKKKVTIPPTLAEQERIVEVLSAVDREISLLQAQREQFELQKRGLMQKLLSGEVEIPADEPEDRYARTG